MLEGGYGQLIQQIASQVKGVRLRCPVSKVTYSPDGVIVTTAAGEEMKADAVIVGAPVGVLQRGGITFDPPLPGWKSTAMQNIGMGKLNKVRPVHSLLIYTQDFKLPIPYTICPGVSRV